MKPNFTDERGTITDLLVTPEYSVTHITFTKGAVRGNHYHKKTKQTDFIVKGKLLVVEQFKKNEDKFTLSKGDMVTFQPNWRHAYKALRNSEIISICFGIRKGQDYEKDVIRLKIPLLK